MLISYLFLFFILCFAVLFSLDFTGTSPTSGGGIFVPRLEKILKSPNIIVDTLNIVHWIGFKKVNIENIKTGINFINPQINKKHPGKKIYVIKDPDHSSYSDKEKNELREFSKDKKITIILAEKLESKNIREVLHQTKGRDDFTLILLADKYQFPILTNDRLKDLNELSLMLPIFRMITMDQHEIKKEIINPERYQAKKFMSPARILPDDILMKMQDFDAWSGIKNECQN